MQFSFERLNLKKSLPNYYRGTTGTCCTCRENGYGMHFQKRCFLKVDFIFGGCLPFQNLMGWKFGFEKVPYSLRGSLTPSMGAIRSQDIAQLFMLPEVMISSFLSVEGMQLRPKVLSVGHQIECLDYLMCLIKLQGNARANR